MQRSNCRVCLSTDLVEFIDFGKVPIAGAFIDPDIIPNITHEKMYPLSLVFCRNCKEVQVLETVPANILYRDYHYFSSTTPLTKHFTKYAQTMKERFGLGETSTVVEFGSNDGVLQEPFRDLGITVTGVEPSTNVVKLARKKELAVINDYFTPNIAQKLAKQIGHADLICANNVFAHIDDIRGTTQAVSYLLKEKGIFVFEVHYLMDMIDELQYDNIYHEHMMYHSVTTLKYLLELYNIKIFDVERIPTHSGSIRVYGTKVPIYSISNVKELIALEKQKGLDKEKTFFEFAKTVNNRKTILSNLVETLTASGKRVAGYGAGGRATMQLNFCKLDIDYVIDSSEEKQGRLIPGVHIPIISPRILEHKPPDYLIIFAYNYAKEIMEKEKNFKGHFIIPLPEVKVI